VPAHGCLRHEPIGSAGEPGRRTRARGISYMKWWQVIVCALTLSVLSLCVEAASRSAQENFRDFFDGQAAIPRPQPSPHRALRLSLPFASPRAALILACARTSRAHGACSPYSEAGHSAHTRLSGLTSSLPLESLPCSRTWEVDIRPSSNPSSTGTHSEKFSLQCLYTVKDPRALNCQKFCQAL
jgi:hypothetical protein